MSTPYPIMRWAIAIASLVVGGGVVLSAWSNHAGANASSDGLLRGQSQFMLESIRNRLGRLDTRPGAVELAEVLEEFRDRGLRYIALLRREPVAAGTPRGEPAQHEPPHLDRESFELWRVADRVRVIARSRGRPPPHHRGHRPPGPPPRHAEPPPFADGKGPRGPRGRRPPLPPPILLELEPLAVNSLMSRARRSLWIAVATAIVLVVAALLAFRWLKRREELDRKLEGERHLATLGQMSAVLAHEIRNPLASLKGHAQLLAEVLPDGKPKNKADRVVREAIRLEQLITGLLAFVRTGSIQRKEADPVAALRRAVDEVHPERTRIEADRAPATWFLDQSRVGQVLSNLLRNAFQASPEDAQVIATVTRSKKGLVYTVRDHGKGIEPGQEKAIFAAFHTKRTQGTGLGLAVAKRVVELHGGTIHAENHPDGGAVFRIVIPEKV